MALIREGREISKLVVNLRQVRAALLGLALARLTKIPLLGLAPRWLGLTRKLISKKKN